MQAKKRGSQGGANNERELDNVTDGSDSSDPAAQDKWKLRLSFVWTLMVVVPTLLGS